MRPGASLRTALAAALCASAAHGQTVRVVPAQGVVPGVFGTVGAAGPTGILSPAMPGLSMGLSAPAPTALPSLELPSPAPSRPGTIPVRVAVRPAAAPLPGSPDARGRAVQEKPLESARARLSELGGGVSRIAEGLEKSPDASAETAGSAGRALESLLTGERPVPASAQEPAAPASPEELSFAVKAAAELAVIADDLVAERGQKAKTMSGADFLAALEDARASSAERDRERAPSPAAYAAARVVQEQVVRVVRALLDPAAPLMQGISRVLSVWQVFGQEMEIAAAQGTLAAVLADARLFASQVEDSVRPAPAAETAFARALRAARTNGVSAPGLFPKTATPEDPNGYKSVSVPGSVFGWRPIAESPGHGFAPFDALIRRVLKEKAGAYPEGFELRGASRREDARVYLYGERHTDGGLITENMRRFGEDLRAGGKAIVLVEGYTGRKLRGYDAVRYLADRGFAPEALAAKDMTLTDVEVRGWDEERSYDASKHPLLAYSMDLLELNRLAFSGERGVGYYARFAREAWKAFRQWLGLWQLAIVERNKSLDAALSRALSDADASGATVHAVAGSYHLVESPRLNRVPVLGRPRIRRALEKVLGGRPYWASQPPISRNPAER